MGSLCDAMGRSLNFTAAELYIISRNKDFLEKTIFYRNGRVVPSPFLREWPHAEKAVPYKKHADVATAVAWGGGMFLVVHREPSHAHDSTSAAGSATG